MDILPQLILNSVIAGAIYALVAVGFNLIYGTVKFFDLGYGALTVVGGYAMFLFYKKLEFGLPVSVGLAILGAGLIGWLVNRLGYRPLRARQASGMVMLVASLGGFPFLPDLPPILFSNPLPNFVAGYKWESGVRNFWCRHYLYANHHSREWFGNYGLFGAPFEIYSFRQGDHGRGR